MYDEGGVWDRDWIEEQGQAFLRPFRPAKEGLQWKEGLAAAVEPGEGSPPTPDENATEKETNKEWFRRY